MRARHPQFAIVTGASSAISAMLAGKTEVVPGFFNWLSSQLAQMSPRTLNERIAGKFFR